MDKNQIKLPLHAGARSELFENAKKLRTETTKAEQILWKQLRARRFTNLKFRRQHPLFEFIADFYCHELKLVVEVDGGYHRKKEHKLRDQGRTHELERLGYTVIRFTNEEVEHNLENVLIRLKKVTQQLKSTTPPPSPRGEGRGEVRGGTE